MWTARRTSSIRWLISIGFLFASAIFLSIPAQAQEPSQQTTITGTVISVTRNTLVVKTSDGRYRLFSLERDTIKPNTIPVGSEVQVVSYPSGDPSYRLSYAITLAPQSPAGGGAPAQPDVLPPEVQSAENAIKREARRFQFGVRGGIALDPELIALGFHAQFGPFFSRNLSFRPNFEFDWGEVTYLFGINAEVIYNMPIASRTGRWNMYVGGGPAFNFVQRDLSRPSGVSNVGFSDFNYDSALNVLVGVRYRSGVFTEMRTSIYASPAPVFRLLVGYSF
jgi:hypothetical protein